MASLELSGNANLEIMTKGGPFYRYYRDPVSKSLVRDPVHVFYQAASFAPSAAAHTNTNKFGALYWCARDTHSMSSNSCLFLNEVKEILLGKLTPHLQSAEAQGVAENKCISFITNRNVIDLEAETSDQLAAWLQGFIALFSAHGSNVELENNSVSDSSDRASSRRFSVVPQRAVHSNNNTAAANNGERNEFVEHMLIGDRFTLYSNTPNTPPQPIWLWYVRGDGKSGTLYWSLDGRKLDKPIDTQKLPLHTITDIYTGRQKFLDQSAKEDACFTIITKNGLNFNVEGSSQFHIQSWLSAINWILSTVAKKRVVLEDENKQVQSPVPVAVPKPVKKAVEETTDMRSKFLELAKQHGDLKSIQSTIQDGQELIKGMERGTICVGYALDRRGSVVKRLILLFYNRSIGSSGTLYFCTPDDSTSTRVENGNLSVNLEDVQEIVSGKETKLLQQLGAESEASKCFSIITKDQTLDLELTTTEQVQMWVNGLNYVFQSTGQSVVCNAKEKEAPTPAAASMKRSDRRFSILRAATSNQSLQEEYDLGDVLTMSAADLLRDLGSGRITSTPTVKETVRMMANGHPMVLWDYVDREKTKIAPQEVILWYVPHVDSNVPGTLYWVKKGEEKRQNPDNSLNLLGLKTVHLKKSTPIFQSAALESVNKHRCWSLIGAERELNLELDSPEQVSVWAFGIYSVIQSGGMDAVLDEPNQQKKSKSSKRFSIVKPVSSTPSAENASASSTLKSVLAGSTDDAIRIMETGTEFQSYENGSTGPIVRTILLFYAVDETRLGSLYWNHSGVGKKERSPHRCLPLHQITDIYTGRQNQIFKSSIAESADEELCWTVMGKNDVLNLQAANKQQFTCWLFGLNRLITRSGKKVVLEEGAAPKKKDENIGRRRFSVKPGLSSNSTDSSSSAAAAASSLGTPLGVLAEKPTPLLTEGHVFTCYFHDKDNQVVKQKQFVFYQNREIHWCAVGFRVESELNKISIKLLTDVYVGRHTDVFKSPIAASADPQCCLSLVSKNGTFNIEFDSPALLQSWVKELTTIISSNGRKVQEEKGSAPSTRRLSIMPSKMPGLPATGHETVVGMQVKKRASLLTLSTTDTIRVMSEGRRFTRYYEALNGLQKEVITLFYVRERNCFFYCLPGERIGNEARCLRLDKLKEVHVGNKKPIFESPDEAAVPNRCIVLVDDHQRLNLEADSPEQLSTFLFGLQNILSAKGREVLVEDKATPASPTKRAVNDSKRYSIMTTSLADVEKSRYANFKKAVLALPENENLRIMSEGRDFYVWSTDEQGRVYRKLQHVYYLSEEETGKAYRMGAIFYNDLGRKENNFQKKLVIGELTDVYVGKQSQIFLDPAARSANEKTCVTFATSEGALNLEATTAEQMNSFLGGINAVLTGQGMNVLLEESKPVPTASDAFSPKASKKTQKRFSIMPPADITGVDLSDPRLALASYQAGKRQSMLGVATHEARSMMEEGRRFNRFHQVNNSYIVSTITLFYVKAVDSLFWDTPGSRNQIPANQIKLSDVVDIWLGKQQPAFKSPIAEQAQNNRCLSVVTKQGLSLDVEAISVEQLSATLFALQNLLVKGGKQVCVDSDNSNKPVRSAGAARSKRFSILTTDMADIEQSRHAQFKKALLAIPREENLRMMTEGHVFTLYTIDARGNGSRAKVHVFYHPSTAAICWCPVGLRQLVPNQQIELQKLTDVYVGKQSPVFKLPIAAQADRQKCITLQSPVNVLNIEGDSVDLITAWLSGINQLLNSSGMQVLIDSPDNASAAAANNIAANRGDRRYSILPYIKPKALPSTAQETMICVQQQSETLKQVNVRDTINMMSQGRRFTRFFLDASNNSVKKEVVSIFYSKSNNCLMWCNPGERVMHPQQSIKVQDIRKVLLGKQTKVLKSDYAASALNVRCVAIVDLHGHELNIEAETTEILSAWLFGLQSLVSKVGKNVVVDTPAQHKERMERQAQVRSPAKAKPLPTSNANDTMRQLANRRATLLAMSDSVNEAEMGELQRFTRYSLANNSIKVEPVQVFITDRIIYWCPANAPRLKLTSCSLPLSAIRDVWLGRQSSVFQHPSACTAVPANCVTLQSPNQQLDLEAETSEQLNSWLFALQAMFSKAGRSVCVDDADEQKKAPSAAAAGSSKGAAAPAPKPAAGKRFSIMTTSLEGVENSRHKGFKEAILSLDPADNIRLMSKGGVFTVYETNSRGQTTRRSQNVFYKFDVGSIVWCDAGQYTVVSGQVLPLKQLRDVYVGKQYGPLKSTLASQADEKRCLSLVTPQVQLNFETETAAQLNSWLAGLNFLLNAGGMAVLLESGDGADAPAPAAKSPASSSSAAPTALSAGTTGSGRRFSVAPFTPPAALPSNPTETVTQLSQRRPTLLALSTNSTVAMMSTGRNFIRVQALSNGTYVTQPIHFWYQQPSATETIESFYWNEKGVHQVKTGQFIPLSSITDIYLGKQTPGFASPAAASLNANCCVSIVSPTITMDLCCESVELLSSWLFGLNRLLTGAGRDVQLDESKGAAQPATAKQVEKRRFSVVPQKPAAAAAPAALAAPVVERRPSIPDYLKDPNVVAMMAGSTWYLYHVNEADASVTKSEVTLFYEPSGVAIGSMYWSSQGRVINSLKSIPLRAVSDVFVGPPESGDHGRVFNSSAAAGANIDLCLTLVTPSQEVNLEAVNEDTLNQYLDGLREILQNSGRKVVEEEEEEKPKPAPQPQPKPARRMSVMPNASATPAPVLAAKPPSAPEVQLMSKGSEFYLYTSVNGTAVRRSVDLFYTVTNGVGSIQWDEVGSRRVIPAQCISTSELSDVFCGEPDDGTHGLVFSKAGDKPYDIDRCITLATADNKKELNLEARDDDCMNSWLEGLRIVLEESGRNVVQEEEPAPVAAAAPVAPAQPAPAAGKTRRLSVLPADASTLAASSTVTARPNVLCVSSYENINMLRHGSKFERYVWNAWNFSIDHHTIWLYYRAAENGVGSGKIHWTEIEPTNGTDELEPDSEHEIKLSDITDITMGNTHDAFSKLDSPLIAALNPNKLFSIVGTSFSINLEAASEETMAAYVLALNNLLGRTQRAFAAETAHPADDSSNQVIYSSDPNGPSDLNLLPEIIESDGDEEDGDESD